MSISNPNPSEMAETEEAQWSECLTNNPSYNSPIPELIFDEEEMPRLDLFFEQAANTESNTIADEDRGPEPKSMIEKDHHMDNRNPIDLPECEIGPHTKALNQRESFLQEAPTPACLVQRRASQTHPQTTNIQSTPNHGESLPQEAPTPACLVQRRASQTHSQTTKKQSTDKITPKLDTPHHPTKVTPTTSDSNKKKGAKKAKEITRGEKTKPKTDRRVSKLNTPRTDPVESANPEKSETAKIADKATTNTMSGLDKKREERPKADQNIVSRGEETEVISEATQKNPVNTNDTRSTETAGEPMEQHTAASQPASTLNEKMIDDITTSMEDLTVAKEITNEMNSDVHMPETAIDQILKLRDQLGPREESTPSPEPMEQQRSEGAPNPPETQPPMTEEATDTQEQGMPRYMPNYNWIASDDLNEDTTFKRSSSCPVPTANVASVFGSMLDNNIIPTYPQNLEVAARFYEANKQEPFPKTNVTGYVDFQESTAMDAEYDHQTPSLEGEIISATSEFCYVHVPDLSWNDRHLGLMRINIGYTRLGNTQLGIAPESYELSSRVRIIHAALSRTAKKWNTDEIQSRGRSVYDNVELLHCLWTATTIVPTYACTSISRTFGVVRVCVDATTMAKENRKNEQNPARHQNQELAPQVVQAVRIVDEVFASGIDIPTRLFRLGSDLATLKNGDYLRGQLYLVNDGYLIIPRFSKTQPWTVLLPDTETNRRNYRMQCLPVTKSEELEDGTWAETKIQYTLPSRTKRLAPQELTTLRNPSEELANPYRRESTEEEISNAAGAALLMSSYQSHCKSLAYSAEMSLHIQMNTNSEGEEQFVARVELDPFETESLCGERDPDGWKENTSLLVRCSDNASKSIDLACRITTVDKRPIKEGDVSRSIATVNLLFNDTDGAYIRYLKLQEAPHDYVIRPPSSRENARVVALKNKIADHDDGRFLPALLGCASGYAQPSQITLPTTSPREKQRFEQRSVLENILGSPDMIAVVTSGPGAGKSHLAAAIAAAYADTGVITGGRNERTAEQEARVKMNQKINVARKKAKKGNSARRMLIVGPTVMSVEAVTMKIEAVAPDVRYLVCYAEATLPERGKRNTNNPYDLVADIDSFIPAENQSNDLKTLRTKVNSLKAALEEEHANPTGKIDGAAIRELKEMQKKLMERAVLEYDPAIIIATTRRAYNLPLPLDDFHILLIDESSQVSIAETLALTKALLSLEKLILVGDSLQLPPYFFGEDSCEARTTLLRAVLESIQATLAAPVNTLRCCGRCHPALLNTLISPRYPFELVPAVTEEERDSLITRTLLPNERVPFVMINSDIRESGRNLNTGHSDLTAALLNRLLQNGYKKEEVVVLAYYKAQVLNIRSVLQRNGLYGTGVHTIDSYQGREARVVVLVTTRMVGNDKRADDSMVFVGNMMRSNVAVSRATDGLFVIGNCRSLLKTDYWNETLKGAASIGAIVRDDYVTCPQSAIVRDGPILRNAHTILTMNIQELTRPRYTPGDRRRNTSQLGIPNRKYRRDDQMYHHPRGIPENNTPHTNTTAHTITVTNTDYPQLGTSHPQPTVQWPKVVFNRKSIFVPPASSTPSVSTSHTYAQHSGNSDQHHPPAGPSVNEHSSGSNMRGYAPARGTSRGGRGRGNDRGRRRPYQQYHY